MIYLYEFPQFEDVNIEGLKLMVETHEEKKNKPEARGGSEGIKVYPGMQKFIDDMLKKCGIETKEIDGKIFASKVCKFKKALVPELDENGRNKSIEITNLPQHVGDKYVDSQRDQLDYFAELLEKKKIDIDWILDVLPHESMHIFIDGSGTLVEGTTERLTRECADKYGLRLTPTSHQRETEIMAKVEKIIGRENLAEAMCLTNEEKRERKENKAAVDIKRLERMEELIDEKMGIGTFKMLQSDFEIEYKKFMN